jgi:SAM-dependent methyltransferase
MTERYRRRRADAKGGSSGAAASWITRRFIRATIATNMAQGPVIFDRRLLRVRQRRAAALGASTFLLERAGEDLADRLAAVLRRFETALDLGTATDVARRVLAESGKVGTIATANALFGRAAGRGGLAVIADEEMLPFREASLDLVVSLLALQFVNDLPGTMVQIRRALRPDGLFIAALLGGATLAELRESFAAAEAEIEDGVSPRIAPFADLRDLGALLQRAGFALPVTDIDRVAVRYESPLALMHDLRRMGATNALVDRRRQPLRRGTLARMAEIYRARFADPDGRVRATFEIVWLSGWAPHESQQQPLAPGSARARLADALGSREQSAGEKAGR